MTDFSLENELGGTVAGIDEAGRGPWAGPVVAAAVIFQGSALPDEILNGVKDSKKLKPAVRDTLFEIIQRHALVGVGQASVEEIDRINILQATMLAMKRALNDLGVVPDTALVDGNRAPDLPCRVLTIIKGDDKSLSIAAASIIAKVTRDRIMVELDARYPGYGFARHKGYGTRAHSAAIARLGVTPVHRCSFRPIRMFLEESTESTG